MSVSASIWVIALINTFIIYPRRIVEISVAGKVLVSQEEEEEITKTITLCTIDEASADSEHGTMTIVNVSKENDSVVDETPCKMEAVEELNQENQYVADAEDNVENNYEINSNVSSNKHPMSCTTVTQRKNMKSGYASSDIKDTSEEWVKKSFLDKVNEKHFNAETSEGHNESRNNINSKVNQTKLDGNEFQQSADISQLCKSKKHPSQKRNGVAKDSSPSYRIKRFRNYMCSALYLVFCYWFTILNLRLQGYIGSFNTWIDTVSEHNIMKGMYI